MTQYTVTKATKKSVTVAITYKTGKVASHTIKDRQSFLDAVAYIVKDAECVNLLKDCSSVLDASTVKELQRFYTPTKTQKEAATKNKVSRENWYKKNEKRLNQEIEKMANHPGFLGAGVSKQDIDSVATKEVRKLYGV